MSLDMVDSCELLSTKLTLERPSRTTMKETVSYKVVRRYFLHADLAELEVLAFLSRRDGTRHRGGKNWSIHSLLMKFDLLLGKDSIGGSCQISTRRGGTAG